MFFDQYSRYRAVSKSLEYLTDVLDIPRESILDIGSGPYCLLEKFLPNSGIKYLDPLLHDSTLDIEKSRLFAQDFFSEDLNLESLKSHITVSVDTLEHIPSELRGRFMDQVVALSQSACILAFPSSDTPDASNVDEAVNSLFHSIANEDYPWLEEHKEYGLPSAQEVCERLNSSGYKTITIKQGNSEWLSQLLPYFVVLNEEAQTHEFLREISELFNNELSDIDYSNTAYRTIVIGVKENLAPPELDSDTLNNYVFSKRENKGKEIIQEMRRSLLTHGFTLFASTHFIHNDYVSEHDALSVELSDWGTKLQEDIDVYITEIDRLRERQSLLIEKLKIQEDRNSELKNLNDRLQQDTDVYMAEIDSLKKKLVNE